MDKTCTAEKALNVNQFTSYSIEYSYVSLIKFAKYFLRKCFKGRSFNANISLLSPLRKDNDPSFK